MLFSNNSCFPHWFHPLNLHTCRIDVVVHWCPLQRNLWDEYTAIQDKCFNILIFRKLALLKTFMTTQLPIMPPTYSLSGSKRWKLKGNKSAMYEWSLKTSNFCYNRSGICQVREGRNVTAQDNIPGHCPQKLVSLHCATSHDNTVHW